MTLSKDCLLQTARDSILKKVYQEIQKYAIKIRFSTRCVSYPESSMLLNRGQRGLNPPSLSKECDTKCHTARA
jgi:hypothetical protein